MDKKSKTPSLIEIRVKEYYQFIKKWFWTLPLWQRTIMTTIIGAMGGSTFTGFINKYALYLYAFNTGIRIPIEGVEYIDLLVSVISFIIILSTSFFSILVYSFLEYISSFLQKILPKPKKKSKALVIFTLLQILGFTLAAVSFPSILLSKIIPNINILKIYYTVLIILLLGVSLYKKKNIRKMIILIFIIASILMTLSLLFVKPVYSGFLKSINYGGNINISIEYRAADNTKGKVSGLLLLKTNKNVIIKNNSTHFIDEIPLERVSKTTFKNPHKINNNHKAEMPK